MLNLTSCGIRWMESNDSYRSDHGYNGPIFGVVRERDRPYLIPVSLCNEFCGRGTAYYQPIDVINTVTTWILPVMGLLLQAPYESNQFRRTLKAMLRWLGSPISSTTCVLWNIKALSKCALLVDMAVRSGVPADPTLPFGNIRDSFYILSVMNQFKIHAILPDDSTAERGLKIALFSDSLAMDEVGASLPPLRTKLADELRSRRRRGSVPVFVSLLWFLAALAFSIYLAFGSLGVRATALNLAMGLMLSWMPVFVLACIVDRNPYSTGTVRKLLNEFVASVAESVKERPDTIFIAPKHEDRETSWIQNLQRNLRADDEAPEEERKFNRFFTEFAGQGRTRWHYGVAHSILTDIEDTILADIEHNGVSSSGRGWFWGDMVRDNIIRGPNERPTGLHHFNFQEAWQAVQAIVIVEGTLAGAFTLAYCTPTYGLGCRSGGFMIFMILTLFSFCLEIYFWIDMDRQYQGVEADFVGGRRSDQPKWTWLSELKFKYREPLLLVLDLIITGWLFYIVWAQTVGAWETCDCVGSTWGRIGHGPGGYIDFLSVVQYKAEGIKIYWGLGTATSMGIMFVAMTHIIIAWCTQSHLSTKEYKQAKKGLELTRRWKHFWFPLVNGGLHRLAAYLFNRCMAFWRFLCCKRSRPHSKNISWEPMMRGDENGISESYPLNRIEPRGMV